MKLMASYEDRRQVLVTGADQERAKLKALFDKEVLRRWLLQEADSFERARFLLQHENWDVLLIDESLHRQDSAGMDWLTRHAGVPWVYLAKANPDLIADALTHGLGHWAPRDLAFDHPGMLAAILQQADRIGEVRRQGNLARNDLRESRRQVNRLVGLLWESSPADPGTSWFTQRHMMDRLHEEVSRTERHGIPLTVVLGEFQPRDGHAGGEDIHRLGQWTAEQISRTKRRPDVAGQYGPNGFMLLLVHTPEQGAVTCCERIKQILERPPASIPAPPLPTEVFFGIASYAAPVTNSKTLLSRAEERLDKAKSGKILAK